MPLLIDLVRHGEAEPTNPAGDRARHLTPAGEGMLEALASRLAGGGSLPSRVWSSPRERALESARILTRRAVPDVEVEVLEALEPDVHPSDVLEALAALGIREGHVMLVGHLPQVEELHYLLTDTSPPFPVATLRRVLFDGRVGAGIGRPVLMLRP